MNTDSKMSSLLQEQGDDQERKLPLPGSLVKGTVIERSKGSILVDLTNHIIGIVAGKHMKDNMGTAKSVKAGDTLSAMVVEDEGEDGFVVLSLRRASQERAWEFLQEVYKEGTTFEVTAGAANRGGLLLDYNGVSGFIPVSQLSPENYPRVNAANTNEILQKLKEFVGKKFLVKCIGLNEENRTVVLSEREAYADQRSKALENIKIGDKVKVKILGVVNFGFFVTFNGLEGLIHISEITWDHVKNPLYYGKVGDEVEAMVTNVENEKISLSMKQLTTDPWVSVLEEFSLNKIVEGEVKRITSNGAYVELKESLNGLVPASEAPEGEDVFKFFTVGKKVKARIAEINQGERKIILSLDLEAISDPQPESKEESVEKKDPSPNQEEGKEEKEGEEKKEKVAQKDSKEVKDSEEDSSKEEEVKK